VISRESVVYVIDDDEAVRESLAFLLASARLPVQTFGSALEFLGQLPDLAPGCVVTDVRMPEMDGLQLLQQLRTRDVALPVIVITGHGDVPMAVEAMKIGAADFLEKPFDDDALLASVRAALNRHEKDAQREAEKREILDRVASLSARERQVLDALIAGHANKVIAFDLGISPRTVEIYRANVMTKMQANSLSGLVRMAMLAGVSDARAS
jgi:two-component system, LuxR family, response regulator FixJ